VFGDSVLTVNVTDNGGTAYGGVNTFARTFLLTVMSVNDIPTFTPGADVTIVENSGITRIEKWLMTYSTGATNEGSQRLSDNFTLNRPDTLVGHPWIDWAARALIFEVQTNAFGTTVVSMTLSDGMAFSVTKTFRIIITPINDAPTFIPGLPLLAIGNAMASYSLPWATNISAGPREDSQTVAFEVTTTTPELFAANGQPTVTARGDLQFTVVAGARGNTTLSVTLRDSDNGRSTTSYVMLFVTALNANTLVTMTLNAAYDGFNVEQFRTIVAEELGVDRSQIVVLRVERGSVRVTFQVLGTANGESSDALTQRLLSKAANASSTMASRLSILLVSTQPVASYATPSPAWPSPRSDGDAGINYVGLGVGLGVGIIAVVIIIAALVVFTRRKAAAKRFAQYSGLERSPYENEEPPTASTNPVHQFDDAQDLAPPQAMSPPRYSPPRPPPPTHPPSAISASTNQSPSRWPTFERGTF
jgi:hypothetical protein